jgi:hypothetical protein
LRRGEAEAGGGAAHRVEVFAPCSHDRPR